jgi:hypothetical protein
MKGGAGNDFYYISDADDEVIEAGGKGKDTVYANATYALAAGQEIEVLSLQGIGSLSGTGNEFANTIIAARATTSMSWTPSETRSRSWPGRAPATGSIPSWPTTRSGRTWRISSS